MRAVVQRVSEAKVVVNHEEVGTIGKGFLIFVGVEDEDTQEDIDYLSRKIANMRIFEDEDGKMNLSLKKVAGEILSVSQFTLHADTKKGNRPSFVKAAGGKYAETMYEKLNNSLAKEGIVVRTGVFGADMDVSLVNDGPVTILIDSKDR